MILIENTNRNIIPTLIFYRINYTSFSYRLFKNILNFAFN